MRVRGEVDGLAVDDSFLTSPDTIPAVLPSDRPTLYPTPTRPAPTPTASVGGSAEAVGERPADIAPRTTGDAEATAGAAASDHLPIRSGPASVGALIVAGLFIYHYRRRGRVGATAMLGA